jgi:phosphate starvation-inducible PhoH-like protein
MSKRLKGNLTNSKQKYPSSIEKEIFIKHKINAKNTAQQLYLDFLRETPITICLGPAGSGKTYLVTAIALEKLLSKEVNRIVITRPVVEAGEHLGYLPGTLSEKLHPYLLPLLDSIEDHIGPTMTKKLFDNNKIEIAPLAFMRGRTFNNCFVILDEAQNATKEQIKMFITRIGFNSYFAINGDSSQSDLPNKFDNGLIWISNKLKGVSSDIIVHEFNKKDVVRHPLIETILTHLESSKK